MEPGCGSWRPCACKSSLWTSPAGDVAYGVAKAATDKMTADMAEELRVHSVAVVSLYPGLVRTEKVMEAAAYLDLSNSESPQFIGRTIAALAIDPIVNARSGTVVAAAAYAKEQGVLDIDGLRCHRQDKEPSRSLPFLLEAR